MTTSPLYYVEQGVLITIFSVFFVLACLQLRAHRHFPRKAKLIQRTFTFSNLFISVYALIWLVDPRGVHEVYPWQLLPWLKDPITLILLYDGALWLSQVLWVWFNSNHSTLNGSHFVTHLERYVCYGPTLLNGVMMVLANGMRVWLNRVWPIGIFTFWIAITVLFWHLIVQVCLRHVLDTYKAVAGAINNSDNAKKERNLVINRLNVAKYLTFALVLFEIFQTWDIFRNFSYKESDNEHPDPAVFSAFYTVWSWILVISVLFYGSWLPVMSSRTIHHLAEEEKKQREVELLEKRRKFSKTGNSEDDRKSHNGNGSRIPRTPSGNEVVGLRLSLAADSTARESEPLPSSPKAPQPPTPQAPAEPNGSQNQHQALPEEHPELEKSRSKVTKFLEMAKNLSSPSSSHSRLHDEPEANEL